MIDQKNVLTQQQHGPGWRRCSEWDRRSAWPFLFAVAQTRTQDDQVTSAPSAVKVSMRTAVWMVL